MTSNFVNNDNKITMWFSYYNNNDFGAFGSKTLSVPIATVESTMNILTSLPWRPLFRMEWMETQMKWPPTLPMMQVFP